MKKLLHNYLPAHFRSPLKLAGRLIRTRDSAAMYAMAVAGMGLAASPLDWGLSWIERRKYRQAPAGTHPLLFICGAPRSGTTVVHQTLAAELPVTVFTNVVNIFPRAPLVATRTLRRLVERPHRTLHSFYGRTAGLGGLNDALPLWDRYIGHERTAEPRLRDDQLAHDMRQFFGAWTHAYDRPLISKCNRLNAVAGDVADAAPEATFICMLRSPLWQAQSLYDARRMIHGRLSQPYGLAPRASWDADDPVESVCQQVLYHHNTALAQLQRIGPERFWLVSYEAFCAAPGRLIARAAARLAIEPRTPEPERLPPLRVRNVARIDPDVLDRMESRLTEMGLVGRNGDVARFDVQNATPTHPHAMAEADRLAVRTATRPSDA
ncbi:MAG: sulfotransferase [Planctomycetales bacterium]|nr:sulfotransferase [Planctomycetales bacterium]